MSNSGVRLAADEAEVMKCAYGANRTFLRHMLDFLFWRTAK